jgi:excisionase family DNA binding protein
MADAPSASSKRSTIASPRLDPVTEQLRDDSEAFVRLAALAPRTTPPQLSSIVQYARPPPAASDDTELSVRCYSVKETAQLLRLGLSRTYEAIASGRIPAVRFGNRWLVPHNELVGLLERLKKERLQAMSSAKEAAIAVAARTTAKTIVPPHRRRGPRPIKAA